MKRYCFALDLKNDQHLIKEYEAYHERIWPEITESIRSAGIIQMQIFRISNRLFMIMDTVDEFSLEKKAAADQSNPKVQQWEQLMWKFQQPFPGAPPAEKWQIMDCIFDLDING